MMKSLMAIKCTSVRPGLKASLKRWCDAAYIKALDRVQGFTRSHWTQPLGKYLHRIAPAATRVAGKTIMMEKYTLFAGHSDGHGDALIPYRAHHPSKGVQGYSVNHWLPPPGEYCSW